MDRFAGRPLKKLHADILDDIACECAIAEAMPDVIDELLVVLDECGDQRGVGGIAGQACHIVTG